MPKISEERKTERREQILEGARRCFAEHGYEGATVAKLEREIGLSRGAIFNYFPSKEDLFIELAVRDSARMSEVWINEGSRPSSARSSSSIRPGSRVYLELVSARADRPELPASASRSGTTELAPANRARIEEAQRDGEFRDDLAAKEIGTFVNLVLNGLALLRAGGDELPSTELVLSLLRDAIGRELVGVRLRVHPPDALDLVDVGLRLRERDPTAVREPAVDVPLARVVRGEREPHVAVVAVAQVVEVPRAVADVDLRIAEIGDDEPSCRPCAARCPSPSPGGAA